MPNRLVDLVKIYTTGGGTGPIVLGSAVSGFRGIEALIDGETYGYSIQFGGKYEVGVGEFSAVSGTLTRTVRNSSNGNSPINLPANAVINFPALSEDFALPGPQGPPGPPGTPADITAFLDRASNLSDLTDVPAARVNLGLAAAAFCVSTFAGIASASIPTDVNVIATEGYAAPGVGGMCYVSDAIANAGLALGHPLACIQNTADSRYWRAVGVEIDFEQLGASATPGFNNRPAVMGSINYAKAVGIRRVQPSQDWQTYELWAPTLTLANTDVPFDTAGPTNFITISADLTLWGRGAYFALKAYNGGSLTTVTQAITGNAAWRGHGLNIIGGTSGTSSFGIKGVALFNFTMDGGSDRVTGANAAAELAYSDYLSNKGLRIQDTGIGELYCENVTLKRFRGEVWYLGQLMNSVKVTLVNCRGYSSNQSALNPSSGNLTVIGGEFGDAPLGCESLGGVGQDFIGTRFYNTWQCDFAGAAAYGAVGITGNFNQPTNLGTEKIEPYITFKDAIFDSCGSVGMSNYIRGNVHLTDSGIVASAISPGCLHDMTLAIDAVTHKAAPTTAIFSVQGPAGNAVPYFSGVIDLPRNIHVKVNHRRSKYAKANNINVTALWSVSGLVDQDTVRLETGLADANALVSVSSNLSMPLVTQGQWADSTVGSGTLYGATTLNIGASPGSYSLTPTSPRIGLVSTGAARMDVTMNTAPFTAPGAFPHGFILTLYYNGNTPAGSEFAFAKNGAGLRLNDDRILQEREEELTIQLDKYNGNVWREVNFRSRQHLAKPVTVTAATYTRRTGDDNLIFNTTATCTLTLPSAATYPGRIIRVRTIAAFAVNSASANVVPLAGGAAGTAILAATAGKFAVLQSDGANWQIMEAN